MSYTRKFSREVSVYYSGSVSYPASKTGGSVPYSGTAKETVYVEVNVDTEDFDASVANCNSSVNGLTASVGAMNAAQCLAIKNNADKVSQTIINGFFHTARTDLSAQQAELEQTVTARLGLLREQSKQLHKKQDEMRENYARTSSRYNKTFNDLNDELATNIHRLDEDVFKFVDLVGQQSGRMLHTDMVQNAITLSKESSAAQSALGAATIKQHALHAMQQAQDFLTSKAHSEQTLRDTAIEGSGNDSYLIPVCCLETTDEHHQAQRKCVLPEMFASMQQRVSDRMDTSIFEQPSALMTQEEKMLLQSYMQEEIANHLNGSDEHASRVRELINKMFNDLALTL